MTDSDFHLECRAEEASLHKRIAELEAVVDQKESIINDAREHLRNQADRIAELEAQVAPLEGRSAVDHMRYQSELETKVVKLSKQVAELRQAAQAMT